MRRRYKKSNHLGHRFSWFQGGKPGRDLYIVIFLIILFVTFAYWIPFLPFVLTGGLIMAFFAENKEFKRREKEIEDEKQ